LFAQHGQFQLGAQVIIMWKEEDNCLHRMFEFSNFTEAFSFMTAVAIEAEKMDHHPDWQNIWNKVIFRLSTHSAGNTVTQKDRDLAILIDNIYKKYSS